MHDGTVSGPNCIARFEDVRAVISVLLSTTCNPTFAVSVTLKHLQRRDEAVWRRTGVCYSAYKARGNFW